MNGPRRRAGAEGQARVDGPHGSAASGPLPIKYTTAPWDYLPELHGWDGYPCGLAFAARSAVEFAEKVVEIDADGEGLDWASQIQRRCDATIRELVHRLPPMIGERAKVAAIKLMIEQGRRL